MFKKSFLLFSVAVVIATGASAATVIFDNRSSNPGGTLTFGTSAGIASLQNGVIDQVTRINGSVISYGVTGSCGNTGAYGCINFTTGSFLDSSTMGDTVTYRYNAGGSLAITGMADGAAAGTLFGGAAFGSPVTLNYNTVTGLSSLSGTLTPGMLNTNLAAALGVDPKTLGGTDTNSAFSVTFSAGTGTGFASTNSVQVAAAAPVPEPASIALLGTGLVSLAVIRRKKLARN